jgi:myo-inositol-1(or 4)-monophosphatase
MDLQGIAVEAAMIGGQVVRGARPGAPSDVKGAGDYVTVVDHESERVIRAFLVDRTGIPVVGEESGGGTYARHWLVDPLDGTTNFIHGFPAVGISVALIEDGKPVAAAVHAPFLEQTWAATTGGGAVHRGSDGSVSPLSVSSRVVEQAIVGTGFPFRRKQLLPRYLATFRRALERFEDLRRPGAASLDLAWVAAGVFDGFFELGLAPWDVAAGALLVREAGGVVTDWAGGDDWLQGDILAGPPAVHTELLRVATAGAGSTTQ